MATPRAGGAPPVTGDRYLDLFVRFVASRAGELLDGSLTLRLHPVGLHYVASRLEALRELEAVGAGAPVDYLRAYVADLGDHRALEQLRRILRLLTSLKVVAAGPGRDPSPLFLLPFARLRVLELRGCDLRVEINEAWRIRPAVDHTVLPKGKSQAKYEAVTLPENVMDMEVEQPMLFTDTDTAKFRGMRLEDLDEQYVNVNLDDDDLSRAEHHHQAEAVNITLVDNFESGLAETDVFNRFERFDIADDDTTVNITPDQHPQAPSTLISSPPRQEDPPQQQEQYQAAPSPNREEPQQGFEYYSEALCSLLMTEL